MKISFSREEYLSVSSVFENETLDDIDSELSEFNEDVEDMAYELAYTRYALAKTEREFAALKDAARPVVKWWAHKSEWIKDHGGGFACIHKSSSPDKNIAPEQLDELARLCWEG